MRPLHVVIACVSMLSMSPLTVCSAEPAAEDAIDLLFLAPDQPLLLRLHLKVDGKSYLAPFDTFVRQQMTALDSNGDGVVAGDERKKLPAKENIASAESSGEVVRPNEDGGWDTNGAEIVLLTDASITYEELHTYIRRIAGPALAVRIGEASPVGADQGENDPTTGRAVFKQLDANHDRQLSPDEIRTGMPRLIKLDRDDDGAVSFDEVNPPNPFYYSPPQPPLFRPSPPFVVLKASVEQKIVRQFVRQYDQSVDGQAHDMRLSRTELRWPEAWFTEADKNADGELDYDDVEALLEHPVPRLECTLYLADSWARDPAIEIDRRDPLLQAEIRRAVGGSVILFFGRAQVEFSVPDGGQSQDYTELYLAQLKSADTDKNGYVDEKEMRMNYYIQQAFNTADADDDNKLFPAELERYIEPRTAAARARTVVSISNFGRDLFEILDANRDRRVGAKELAAIEEQVALWDNNQDGTLSSLEIPQHFRIILRSGTPSIAAAQFNFGVEARQTRPLTANLPQTTPLWFRKMDRDSDGNLSPREFLGPRDVFDRLDGDKNGQVSTSEAQVAK